MTNLLRIFKPVAFYRISAVVNCHWLNKIGGALLVFVLIVSPKGQAQSVCEGLFGAIQFAKKPENILIGMAANDHFNLKNLNRDIYMREGVKTFIEVIDPLNLVFTKSEYETIEKASSSFWAALEQEVFISPRRSFLEGLRALAQVRYEKLLKKFFHDESIRRKILEIIKSGKSDEDLTARVENESQIEVRLAQMISRYALNIKKAIQDSGREISNAMALKHALKSLGAIEDRIRWSMDSEKLPLIISKSFISAMDPHSDLEIGLDVSQRNNLMRGSFGGVGASFSPDQNGLQIEKLVPGGPAASAGLQTGDVITHISTAEMREKLLKLVKRKKYWYALAGTDVTKAANYLGGEIGKEIHVRVLRKDQKLELKLTRGQIEAGKFNIDIETTKTSKGTIAHVKLTSFFQESEQQLRAAILELKRTTNLSGMILDLRQNGGGSVTDLVGILGLFVYPGSPGIRLVTNEGVDVLDVPKTSEVAWDGPLVVMTDSDSASASEGLSGALQDYGRAIIVGDSQTYGKGTAQYVKPLGTEATLALTYAMLFTPSGRSPQIDGVASDIILESGNPPRFEKDYPNVIAPIKIPAAIPSGFFLMGKRGEIISELTKRSVARRAGQEKLTTEQNTAEAHKIMEDLIELAP